jgi:hypothetical protein
MWILPFNLYTDPDPVPTTHFFPDLDPLMLQNGPLRLQSFHFHADADPAYNFDADPDLAFQFDADLDPDPAFNFDADPDPAS